MRVLFVPHPMPSHVMPLVALARSIRGRTDIECAFLLPQRFHAFARRVGVGLLDIDRQLGTLNPEMRAVSTFHPDVVVDDLSPTTGFLARMARIPRISIVRKGIFPDDSDFAHYPHSSGSDRDFEKLKSRNLQGQRLWDPERLTDMFLGDVNLIPSCPQIEVLPPELREDASYLYTGPLLLDDDEIAEQPVLDDAARFLDAHPDKKVVYFTIGLGTPKILQDMGAPIIQSLLDLGAAVVSNVDPGPLQPSDAERFFHGRLLPMHRLCSRAALMIHQCGSATYAYQLVHGCPAIILGSKARDRDAVASRLHELEAATYVPAESLERDDIRQLTGCAQELLDKGSPLAQRQASATAALRPLLLEAARKFDFSRVLDGIRR